MLRTLLTKWGYHAVIARDGSEAWRILESSEAPRLAVPSHPRALEPHVRGCWAVDLVLGRE